MGDRKPRKVIREAKWKARGHKKPRPLCGNAIIAVSTLIRCASINKCINNKCINSVLYVFARIDLMMRTLMSTRLEQWRHITKKTIRHSWALPFCEFASIFRFAIIHSAAFMIGPESRHRETIDLWRFILVLHDCITAALRCWSCAFPYF